MVISKVAKLNSEFRNVTFQPCESTLLKGEDSKDNIHLVAHYNGGLEYGKPCKGAPLLKTDLITSCRSLGQECAGPMCFACELLKLRSLQHSLEAFLTDRNFYRNSDMYTHLDYENYLPISTLLKYFWEDNVEVTPEDVITVALRSSCIELNATREKVRKVPCELRRVERENFSGFSELPGFVASEVADDLYWKVAKAAFKIPRINQRTVRFHSPAVTAELEVGNTYSKEKSNDVNSKYTYVSQEKEEDRLDNLMVLVPTRLMNEASRRAVEYQKTNQPIHMHAGNSAKVMPAADPPVVNAPVDTAVPDSSVKLSQNDGTSNMKGSNSIISEANFNCSDDSKRATPTTSQNSSSSESAELTCIVKTVVRRRKKQKNKSSSQTHDHETSRNIVREPVSLNAGMNGVEAKKVEIVSIPRAKRRLTKARK